MAKISLKGVSWGEGEKHNILDNVNLCIENGEYVVLTGESSAENSALLELIAGVKQPVSGEIYFDEELVNGQGEEQRKVGVVVPSIPLYPHLNLYDNISFGLKFSTLSKEEIRARVEDIAAVLELSNLLTRKLRALSTGQRQRAVLGKLLVQRPSVLILDESVLVLESRYQVQMRYFLNRIHQNTKTTCLYATTEKEIWNWLGADLVCRIQAGNLVR